MHAKAHGVLEGTLIVDAGLPPELAQGLFAMPGEHKIYMRMSTNAGDILPDTISLPRGLALKVLDVQGERLPGAEGTTQDFVMVNGKVFQAKDADKFLGSLRMLAKTTDRMESTKKAMSSVLRGVNTALEAVGVESTTLGIARRRSERRSSRRDLLQRDAVPGTGPTSPSSPWLRFPPR